MAEPARKLKVAERTAHRIAEQIFTAELGEGAMLPHERVMAEDLGVGRGTLREALRLLETQGIIRIKPGPGGGPVVRRPHPDDLGGAMSMVLQFLGATLGEVAVAREAIEGAIARAAAENADPELILLLQASIDRMRAGAQDDETLHTENELFHHLLAQLSGNSVLLVTGQSLERLGAGIARTLDYPERTRTAIADAHQRVLDAVRAGDPDGAEAASRKHLAEFHAYVARNYGQHLATPVRWDPGTS